MNFLRMSMPVFFDHSIKSTQYIQYGSVKSAECAIATIAENVRAQFEFQYVSDLCDIMSASRRARPGRILLQKSQTRDCVRPKA